MPFLQLFILRQWALTAQQSTVHPAIPLTAEIPVGATQWHYMPLCIQKLLWNGWFACLFQCKSRDFSFIISRNVSHVDVTVASGMENLSCNNFYTGTRWRSLPTGTLCRRTRVVLFFSLGELCGKGKCASSCGETEAQSGDFLWGLVAFQGRGKGSTWNTCAPPPLMEPQRCVGYRRNLLCREAGRWVKNFMFKQAI